MTRACILAGLVTWGVFWMGAAAGGTNARTVSAGESSVLAREEVFAQEVDVGGEAVWRDTTAASDSSRFADEDSEPSRPAGPWYRQPKWIMLRSVVIPGWGQWSNGKHLKSLVVAGGEGFLLYRAIDWGKQERNATDTTDKEYAASRRRDFTWWSIFAAGLSMGDAYVDAHLRGFDVEFKPQDDNASSSRVLSTDPGGSNASREQDRERPIAFRAGLRFRFF